PTPRTDCPQSCRWLPLHRAYWLMVGDTPTPRTECPQLCRWLPLHRAYWLMVGCSPQRGQVAPSRAVGCPCIVITG
ncbi:MAG: hypothetical protein SPM02_04350, partial [Bacteroidales bacterium]|nr:hypothetical protein [Bacteroidales bacterium]